MKPDLPLNDVGIVTELLKDISAEDARKHPRGRHGRPTTNLNLRSFMAGYGLAFLRSSTPEVTDSPAATSCPNCGSSPVRYGISSNNYSHEPSYLVCLQCGARLRPSPASAGEGLPKHSEAIESGWLIEAKSLLGQCMWWDGKSYGTPSMAVRFSRKEDAEAVIDTVLRADKEAHQLQATDHRWI